MFELLTLFLTGGGSAAMGFDTQGCVWECSQFVNRSMRSRMAREARGNEFAIKFQEQLNNGDGGAFTRATRRMLALIGISISFVTCITAIFPSVRNPQYNKYYGEGKTEILFGLLSFPNRASQFGRHYRTPLPLPNMSRVADDRGILLHTRRA